MRINEKDNNGKYPLLEAIEINNIEMVKLLIYYVNKHNIILEINEKASNWKISLLYAIDKNHIKMAKLLIDYAKRHDIILKINDRDDFRIYPLLASTF